MSLALGFLTVLAVSAGAFFFMAGTVGLLRFPDTLSRQEQAFREVADNRPRWVVTINISASFLDDEQTPKFLEERIGELLHAGYRLVGTMEAEDTAVRLADEDRPRKWTFPPDIQHSVALWERRTEAPAESR